MLGVGVGLSDSRMQAYFRLYFITMCYWYSWQVGSHSLSVITPLAQCIFPLATFREPMAYPTAVRPIPRVSVGPITVPNKSRFKRCKITGPHRAPVSCLSVIIPVSRCISLSFVNVAHTHSYVMNPDLFDVPEQYSSRKSQEATQKWDTIGCLYNRLTGRVRFSLNGKLLPPACHWPGRLLYPCVSADNRAEFRVNFGTLLVSLKRARPPYILHGCEVACCVYVALVHPRGEGSA